MNRCKLEYMIKRFDIKEKKRVIQEIDPYGDYMFKKDLSNYLVNPDTKDIEILKYVGPSSMIYYICLENEDSELARLYKMDMEKEVKEIKEQFINQYKLINELCKNNNTYPFFKDPTNIAECEKTRLDLVRIIPEEIINKFYGVESLGDFEPPFYKKVVSYPAVFEKEDEYYNVTVPDIFGGVTCGKGFDGAVSMAKDMIKLMLKEAPGQCFLPKSLEETKNNFKDKIVVMIDVEID